MGMKSNRHPSTSPGLHQRILEAKPTTERQKQARKVYDECGSIGLTARTLNTTYANARGLLLKATGRTGPGKPPRDLTPLKEALKKHPGIPILRISDIIGWRYMDTLKYYHRLKDRGELE